MTAADSAKALQEKFSTGVTAVIEFREEVTALLDLSVLADAMKYLKEGQGYDMLLDVSSIDHMGSEPRFEMVYELYSLSGKRHLRIRSRVAEDVEVPTVSHLWGTANWHEREVYDMMGIVFTGHPDLRRILMWEGYPHFPLRKDFPLAGKSTDIPEVAFTGIAPLAGGPFVTCAGASNRISAEPRAKGESGL